MDRYIFLGILFVFTVAALVLFAVDFFYFLWHRYCRFHIGRWKSTEEWEKAVRKTALRWLKHTPTVKITDNSRYMLLDILKGKYRSGTIQSWQKAALILGLLESGDTQEVSAAKAAAGKLLNEDGTWRKKPAAVDCGMLSYAVMKACGAKEVRPAMDQTVSVMLSYRHKSGMIAYTGRRQDPEMYVDTLGLSCPFLARYAREYHVPELEDLAVFQLKTYREIGMFPNSCLPNHAVNIETKLPCGVYGWGRGTAWYLIGLLDTYQELSGAANKELLRSYITEAAEGLLQYQQADGGFGATLQRMQTYDSSATAVLAWVYASVGRLFDCRVYLDAAKLCLEKLKSKTRIYGALDDCQGDTKGIGIFAQTYDIMPFAQGMMLRCIMMQKRDNI